MNAMWTVFNKEVRENLRQRRTVLNSLLVGPLVGPVVMLLVIGFTIKVQVDRAGQELEVMVVGAEHAPNLTAWLSQNGVVMKGPGGDPERAILDQDEDVVLRIPSSYGERWREGRQATVEILYDESRNEARVPVDRIKKLLAGYRAEVGALRLLARGIDPRIAAPVQIESVHVGKVEGGAVMVLAFLPYLLILGAFTGSMYLAIDTTAGERERRSLEPLLANPVKRSTIMSGKLLATAAFSMTSLTLTVIAFRIAAPFMPLEEAGIDFRLDLSTIGMMLVIVSPVVPFAAAIQTIIAAYAKTYREAQSYLQILMLVPMVPTITFMVVPIKSKLWMMTVPFLSQHQLISTLIRGESVIGLELAVTIASGLGLSALLWLVAARLYERESLAISA